MRVFSKNLGLEEDHLIKAFGGDDNVGACLRVNFYPKCPQPDLTLGLSSHSDPGGMTILLPDENVAGLQVRRGDCWLTVKPIPNAFIINIGDQIQVGFLLTSFVFMSHGTSSDYCCNKYAGAEQCYLQERRASCDCEL